MPNHVTGPNLHKALKTIRCTLETDLNLRVLLGIRYLRRYSISDSDLWKKIKGAGEVSIIGGTITLTTELKTGTRTWSWT